MKLNVLALFAVFNLSIFLGGCGDSQSPEAGQQEPQPAVTSESELALDEALLGEWESLVEDEIDDSLYREVHRFKIKEHYILIDKVCTRRIPDSQLNDSERVRVVVPFEVLSTNSFKPVVSASQSEVFYTGADGREHRCTLDLPLGEYSMLIIRSGELQFLHEGPGQTFLPRRLAR